MYVDDKLGGPSVDKLGHTTYVRACVDTKHGGLVRRCVRKGRGPRVLFVCTPRGSRGQAWSEAGRRIMDARKLVFSEVGSIKSLLLKIRVNFRSKMAVQNKSIKIVFRSPESPKTLEGLSCFAKSDEILQICRI